MGEDLIGKGEGNTFTWCNIVIPTIKMPNFKKIASEARAAREAERELRNVDRKVKLKERVESFALYLEQNLGGSGFDGSTGEGAFVSAILAAATQGAEGGGVYGVLNGVTPGGELPSLTETTKDGRERRVFEAVGEMPPRRASEGQRAEVKDADAYLWSGLDASGVPTEVPSGRDQSTPIVQLLNGYGDGREGGAGSGLRRFREDVTCGTSLDVLNAKLTSAETGLTIVMSKHRGSLYLRVIWDEDSYVEHERASAAKRQAAWKAKQGQGGGRRGGGASGGGGHRGREDKDGFTLVRRGRRGGGGGGGGASGGAGGKA